MQDTFQPKSRKLHNNWTVFFTERISRDAQFANKLQNVGSVSTVEEFAYIYSRLKRPSQLAPGTSIYFVRNGSVQLPIWEQHVNGGTFQFRRYTDKSTRIQRIDRTWERVLFDVISERFQEPIISAVQITAKVDHCQITIWNFQSISRREFSRIQLKLGDLLECKVADIEYITNIDAIKEKDRMRQLDLEKKEERKAKEVKPEPAAKPEAKEVVQKPKEVKETAEQQKPAEEKPML